MIARHPLLIVSLMVIASGSVARAESGAPPGEVAAASSATVGEPAVPETASTEAPKPAPASARARPRTSDALIRALMVISSAGGNRPFPLVPR